MVGEEGTNPEKRHQIEKQEHFELREGRCISEPLTLVWLREGEKRLRARGQKGENQTKKGGLHLDERSAQTTCSLNLPDERSLQSRLKRGK